MLKQRNSEMEKIVEVSVVDDMKALYRKVIGSEAEVFYALPGSGSNRQYFRIGKPGTTMIAAYNADLKENKAFLSFSRSFREQGLPVPEILAESCNGFYYLIQDLGDLTLYAFLQELRKKKEKFPQDVLSVYKKVLALLPRFQVSSAPDYSNAYPRSAFDRQSMLWDLNYFKYYYLKLAGIPFDEQQLEDDFRAFTSFLLEVPSGYFMYRDFQSRNIMLCNGQPWFIDYQGGRRGALQYDVASLLYDAKADIPEGVRTELLDFYLHSLSSVISTDRQEFLRYYPGFVLIRIFQAMGAYGFRGYYEKKSHFLQSIPFALTNLSAIVHHDLLNDFPELRRVINRMILTPFMKSSREVTTSGSVKHDLHVFITSFSFKQGPPADPSPNGGGFVFDCRALPNPGRDEELRQFNGMDQPVIDFLQNEPAVNSFLSGVFSLLDQSVDNYLFRGFTHLMVSFGCTGGQHRSVYCAEALAKHLGERNFLKIEVKHLGLNEFNSIAKS